MFLAKLPDLDLRLSYSHYFTLKISVSLHIAYTHYNTQTHDTQHLLSAVIAYLRSHVQVRSAVTGPCAHARTMCAMQVVR